MLRYHTICDQPERLQALTGLPPHVFMLFVPCFAQAFERRMRTQTLDGYQREGRHHITYSNSPLPTPEDQLLFILTYLKQNLIQQVHGQLFGMTQSNVSKWYRLLAQVLFDALNAQNLIPARTAEELLHLLATSGGEMGWMVHTADEATKDDAGMETSPPLFFMMAPSDQYSAPVTR